MDFKKNISFRNEHKDQYNRHHLNKYDYEKEGILIKCLPKVLFKGNPILVSFLQLIDLKAIMLFKYIDKVKTFKHITKL